MAKQLRGPQILIIPLLIGLWFFVSHLNGTSASEVRGPASIGSKSTLLSAYAGWKISAARTGEHQRLDLFLRYYDDYTHRSSTATGHASIYLETGLLTVTADNLDSEKSYDVWFVDNRSENDEGVKPGDGDIFVLVGELEFSGANHSLETQLDQDDLQGFGLDVLAVTEKGVLPSYPTLVGAPGLFQRLYYNEYRSRADALAATGLGLPVPNAISTPWTVLIPPPAYAGFPTSSASLDSMIAAGEALFFNETFDGNGRTCGTCHPATNNFTIDTTWIAGLPANDPLFVNEFTPALDSLENSVLMRGFALILENVDGLEDPTNKFVMRGVPHTLGLATTIASGSGVPPLDRTGWGGDGAPNNGTLRDFPTGAVRQHLTKTLDRVVSVDFRFPTDDELDALEAFVLSLGRPGDYDLFSMKFRDAFVDSGRVLFLTMDTNGGTQLAGKCQFCHVNGGGLSTLMPGINQNFDTGIEDRPHPAIATGEPMPRDGGFGTTFDPISGGFGNGKFNTTSVVESADTPPFFHNNVEGDLRQAVSFYVTPLFNNSPSGLLLKTFDTGGVGINAGPDEMTAFLQALNAIENLRVAQDLQFRARLEQDTAVVNRLLTVAASEIEDAMQVLTEGLLHPEVMPHLVTADSLNTLAKGEAGILNRTPLLNSAIAEEGAARDSILDSSVTTDVPGMIETLASLHLSQNHPNPFRGETVIDFRLTNPGHVLLTVYSVEGRMVRRLAGGEKSAGLHSVKWDGRNEAGIRMGSGTYFYRLSFAGQAKTKTMVFIR